MMSTPEASILTEIGLPLWSEERIWSIVICGGCVDVSGLICFRQCMWLLTWPQAGECSALKRVGALAVLGSSFEVSQTRIPSAAASESTMTSRQSFSTNTSASSARTCG